MDYQEKFQKELGARIRAIRESLNLTQEQLAEKANLHPIHIGRCERGEVNISVSALVRIANALGISPADVLKTFDEVDGDNVGKKLIDDITILLDRYETKDLETIKRLILALGKQQLYDEE